MRKIKAKVHSNFATAQVPRADRATGNLLIYENRFFIRRKSASYYWEICFHYLDKSVCRKDLRQPGGHGTTRGAHRQHNTDDDDDGDDDGHDGDDR